MSQMTAPVLRTTPLHSVHAAAGAFFTDADGWRMPLRYSCAPTEHRAVRTSAGIFDLSHMGEIKVTGPGAAAALDRALVGRVSTVALGRSLRTLMVTGAGGVIDVLMVHHVGEHEYMVVSVGIHIDVLGRGLELFEALGRAVFRLSEAVVLTVNC